MARPTTNVSLTISTVRYSVPEIWPSELDCPRCPGSLEVHQPDVNHHERLLGTCNSCGAWVLLGLDGTGDSIIGMLLPGVDKHG